MAYEAISKLSYIEFNNSLLCRGCDILRREYHTFYIITFLIYGLRTTRTLYAWGCLLGGWPEFWLTLNSYYMTTFKDYLADIHKTGNIDIDFDDWIWELETKSDELWAFFHEYIKTITNHSKLWRIAYIVLNNQ